jgi:hypothetical protein
MTKSEVLEEKHPGNGTVHSNEKQGSRKSDEGEIKVSSPHSSTAETYQKLLDDSDVKIQLGTKNSYDGKGNSEGNVASLESEERKQKDHNTELSGFRQRRVARLHHEEFNTTCEQKEQSGKSVQLLGIKRSHAPELLFTILGSTHKPHSPGLFSVLLSKRGGYHYVFHGSKKCDPSSAEAVFFSWGGKSSVKLAGQITIKIPPQGIGRQFRREADFYSWGGKH